MMTGPYLTVTEVEGELALRRIDCSITVRPGRYRVLIDGVWAQLQAVEPRITTGAEPVRAVVLCGSGAGATALSHLEATLRSHAGPVRMETQEGQAFSVRFEQLDSTLFLYGQFYRDRLDPEIQYRISLGGRAMTGFAIDRDRDRRRVLVLTELSIDDRQALARALAERVVEVEQIS